MILAVGIVIVMVLGTHFLMQRHSNYVLDKDYKMVIFGNSHSECAYNDALIPKLKNYSKSGETYFYTFQKMKEVIKQNPQIETVFVELSNNQIYTGNDKAIYSAEIMNTMYPTHAAYMNLSDHQFLLFKNPLVFMNSVSISLKDKLSRLVTNDFDYKNRIGGYLPLHHNKVDSLIMVMKKKPLKEFLDRDLSSYNLGYLRKIIEHCRSKNKKIFLLRSPVHDLKFTNKSELEYQKILDMMFSDVKLIDLKDFEVKNDEFADLNHLNIKGAERFSKWFDKNLNKLTKLKTSKN
ncbi:MAG: DUF1574 domain-containing protein [Bacteroidia bacterium]|nr:DUF1574 domain-containing protein [Bacteroidia bacterium]NNE15749.1 hypothetical protein [Saprospiraceae bacterium]